MPQAENLYHLQEIDLQIAKTQARLKEIAQALEDDKVVAAARDEVQTAEEALKPLRTKVRNLELEIQTTTQKGKASEDRLYSGTVKNPKEMQELQQEIDSLKQRNQELEEALLEQMMLVEEAEETLENHQENLGSIQQQWENEHSDLLAEQEQLQADLKTLAAKREEALGPITPESLKTYEQLRPKKGNRPMAALQGRSCGVCGFEQTMQNEDNVRRETGLFPCENCGRILANIG